MNLKWFPGKKPGIPTTSEVRIEPTAPSIAGAVCFYGLLSVILLSSIPSGSVASHHRSLLIVLITILAGIRLADSLRRGSFMLAEWRLLLPLGGVLVLALIQMVRWPGMDSAFSFDPYETRSFILILGCVLLAAEMLFFYTDTRFRLKCLVGLVITAGLGSSVFGIFQEYKLPFMAVHSQYEQGFGQFMNRNHFALLIEMSFGLLFGILIKAELPDKFKFLFWTAAAIFAYSMIVATSRGGLVSLASQILFAILLHIMGRQETPGAHRNIARRSQVTLGALTWRVSSTAVILAAVFSIIVFVTAFVGGDAVATRFERLGGEFDTVNNAGINRGAIWESTGKMIVSHPLLGTGFGAYGAAITRFDSSNGKYSLQQAHNDYLEIISNGGLIGFVLFVGFSAAVFKRVQINLGSNDRLLRPVRFGAAIGIFGVVIHSFVDFGLHVPTNALILTALIVIASSRCCDPKKAVANSGASSLRK